METLVHVNGETGRKQFRLFLLMLMLIVTVLFFPYQDMLVVRDDRTQKLVWQDTLKGNKRFSIRWIHSIHGTPIEEYYAAKGDQLLLEQVSFKDYGIGVDSGLQANEKLVMKNGTFFIENMNRKYPAIHLFIGQVRANHTLLYEGRSIPFGSIAKPGTPVSIQVERRSLIQMMGG
ncbi:DUF1850 domain-containing protein [Brevibacillus daliensis]|uniref:DUF1850 domain-containing protein n=1 Tax=Brevibacillus daliensis TaxID=2892995 RepID=UPI001E2A52F5|nr:DUF1850 domain-containing protein [Brevibacillus daliensis]